MVWFIRQFRTKLEGIKIAAIVIALLASHFYVYLKARQLERNIQEIHQYEQLRNALEEAERIRNKDIELLMGAVKIETQIVETIRTEIVHSECDNLGNDWLQFYNDAIEKSNSFSVSD